MTTPLDDGEREELEHIPWSMLASELDGGRSRTRVSLAIAVIAVVVVGVVAVRTVRRGEGTVIAVPGAATATTVTAASMPDGAAAATEPPVSAPQSAPASAPAPAATLPPPALYTEADLMAVAPEQEQRRAAATAEWFVTEYFTVDQVDDDEPAMWVEWARAVEVGAVAPGRYDVVVLFSTLGRGLDGEYRRAGPRAVRIPVEVTVDGAVPIDLPAPLPVAVDPVFTPPPMGDDAVPEQVAVAAVAAAATFGTEAEVSGGTAGVDGWRIVVSVADPSGLRFPLVVTVDP